MVQQKNCYMFFLSLIAMITVANAHLIARGGHGGGHGGYSGGRGYHHSYGYGTYYGSPYYWGPYWYPTPVVVEEPATTVVVEQPVQREYKEKDHHFCNDE